MNRLNVEPASWRGDPLEGAVVGEEFAARRRRRILVAGAGGVALLALLLVLLFGSGGGSASTDQAESIPRVTVIVPGRQQVSRLISATGNLAARRDMPVGVAGEGGMVAQVMVEAGDWVRAGQTLAVIERSVQAQEARQLAASIDVARADAALAQQELDRAGALINRGFISKADLQRRIATRDAANARVRVAEAQLGQSRARIGRLDIRAPAAGLVLERNVEAGQVVGAASPALFRVAQQGEMELLARLPQEDLGRVTVGMPAAVTPVGSAQSFQGSVWQVAPVIDPQTRLGDARIAIPYHRELRPGGFAAVEIRAGLVDAPLLPESAVQSDDRGTFVLIVGSDKRVLRREIKVGEVSDGGVVIVAGLTGNERVVASAGAFLSAGDKVEPVRASRSAGTGR